MAKIVTVGVTRLSMTFPMEHPATNQPLYRRAPWMECDVTGGAYNVARAMRRLGDRPRLCTTVGKDKEGQLIRKSVRRSRLHGPGVVSVRRSAMMVGLVAPDGQVIRNNWHDGAVDYPMERFIEQAAEADLAVISGNPFGQSFLKVAKQLLRLPVATDLHAASADDEFSRKPWLECADIIFRSHIGLSGTPQEWITEVLEGYPGCQIAVVGRGDQGCLMGLRDGRLVEISAVSPRPVLSTEGAGDALFAAFLHGWLASGEPVGSLESAVLFAGWKIGEASASRGFLSRRELAALRRVHPVHTRVCHWR
jgi:acarbose 7IV-phosphotransferase